MSAGKSGDPAGKIEIGILQVLQIMGTWELLEMCFLRNPAESLKVVPSRIPPKKGGEWKGTKIDRIYHKAIIAKTGGEFIEL